VVGVSVKLRYRSASGDERAWTLKEIVQGKPLGHPSHALFVHFPVAYYIAVLAFDLLTRLQPNAGLVFAATALIIGAFIASVGAVSTGLIDWIGMVPGSRKRRWATRHMLLQLGTFAFFLASLALRWPDRHEPRAAITWIVIEAVGVAVLLVGQWFGGVLVYEMGMRVRTGQVQDE
jgi:uncharacterized membrane protein